GRTHRRCPGAAGLHPDERGGGLQPQPLRSAGAAAEVAPHAGGRPVPPRPKRGQGAEQRQPRL
ncbi:MAG: hypothetical protein AVDCRST_MAG27-2079, partial [uncultured Craurococcus sp.]